MKTNNEVALQKVFEHAQAVDAYCAKIGAVRIMTGLFGSQNYGLDDENSDVDTKSIIVPALTDWLWSTEGESNHVLHMPDGSHAEMKPVVGMFKQFIKGNINFLELLYTPYVDIAPGWEWVYEELINEADNIARHNMYRQASVWFGYIVQMMKRAMCSSEEQGYNNQLRYNPKALMNMLRLKETFIRWFEFHRPFDEAIDMSDSYNDLIAVKHGNIDLNHAETLVLDTEEWLKKWDRYVQQHYVDREVFNVDEFFRNLTVQIIQTLV